MLPVPYSGPEQVIRSETHVWNWANEGYAKHCMHVYV